MSIIRRKIAAKVRSLRKTRRWTQAELATRLGLSQSRLSEVERGLGSFAAEHLLLLARIFNIQPSEFAPSEPVDEHAALQNALARFGATHLRESESVLPDARLNLPRAIEASLISGDSRLLTALAPVLVQGLARIRLTTLYASLAELGFEFRLAWLIDNTIQALRLELAAVPPGQRARRYRRALAVLETAQDEFGVRHRRQPATDLLDPHVRSTKSRRQIVARASATSNRWKIVSDLRTEDFAQALRDAHDPS